MTEEQMSAMPLEEAARWLIEDRSPAVNRNPSRYECARRVRDVAQAILDKLKEVRIEELRTNAEVGRNAEAELSELGAPLKPRAPRSDKGKTRKPKNEQKGLGIDGDGSGSALANA